VEVVGQTAPKLNRSIRVSGYSPTALSAAISVFEGVQRDVPVFERNNLKAGSLFSGPAIVVEDYSTIVVEKNWDAEMLSCGEILLTHSDTQTLDSLAIRNPISDIRNSPDPALLEIFNNHLTGIAEQMGITLRNTASSINVKERLAFSCAIFTADGRLVANAPHVPVHLGAMEETVRATIASNAE